MKYALAFTVLFLIGSCQKSKIIPQIPIDFERLAGLEDNLVEIVNTPYYSNQDSDDIIIKDEHIALFQEFGDLFNG